MRVIFSHEHKSSAGGDALCGGDGSQSGPVNGLDNPVPAPAVAYFIHFYAASLEDPETFEPAFHVHYADRLPWLHLSDDLPKYAGAYE